MSRWRPSPGEERWLELASELGAAIPRGAVTERTGGWRSTGPLARIALFVLGFIAAVLAGALLFSIPGLDDETTLLVTGLISVLAAEWLTVARRLYASGIEEGLCVAGSLLIAAWITTLIAPRSGYAIGTVEMLVLIAATGAAGLRRLNPLVTTCAVLAFIYWMGSTATAHAIDQTIGGGMTAVTVGCALAALALALGAREYRRPSHDRMLDWLVATLPVAAYAQHATSDAYEVLRSLGGGTSRLATAVLLFALGAAMLFIGLRRRRHAPLLGFMGCVACLALELRQVTTLATETWLILYGFAALFAGVALDRYLRQPRNGLTSAAPTHREGALDVLQPAGAAVLAQRTAPELPRPEPPVTGGGGRFGGGGATGSY
ncbi:MAG: hypothetical protein WBM03_17920 [Steroidobacteraceae bacterium]